MSQYRRPALVHADSDGTTVRNSGGVGEAGRSNAEPASSRMVSFEISGVRACSFRAPVFALGGSVESRIELVLIRWEGQSTLTRVRTRVLPQPRRAEDNVTQSRSVDDIGGTTERGAGSPVARESVSAQ